MEVVGGKGVEVRCQDAEVAIRVTSNPHRLKNGQRALFRDYFVEARQSFLEL